MKDSIRQKGHWPLLIGFFVVVSIAIIISVVLKVAEVASKSHFDGVHHFTVAMLHAKGVVVVALEPGDRAVYITLPKPSQRKVLASQLPIPIDGFVTVSSFENQHPKDIFWQLLVTRKKNLEELTQLDLLRLHIALMSLDEKAVSSHETVLPVSLDALSNYSLQDDSIVSENLTIAIENATGSSGIGARAAELLESIGGRVVAVTTGRKTQEVTQVIALDTTSYSSMRIASFFDTTVTPGEGGTADILIRIGERSLGQDFFDTL